MISDTFKDVVRPRNQVIWLLLAFQGGFMNAGGFLAVQRFVSHITGYGTYVGVELGKKNYLGAFEMALAPLFFLAGAAYSGILVDRRILNGREPMIVMGIMSLALINLFIYLAEFSGLLGFFGEPLKLQRDFFLLFCLCFACGMQNGLFSGLTNGQVRTTHLTGPTTDIGLNLVKIFSLDRGDSRRQPLSSANWLRVKVVLLFSLGSLIALLVFEIVTYEGFVVPCVISFFLVWHVRRVLHLAKEEGEGLLPVDSSVVGHELHIARLAILVKHHERLIERHEQLLRSHGQLADGAIDPRLTPDHAEG